MLIFKVCVWVCVWVCVCVSVCVGVANIITTMHSLEDGHGFRSELGQNFLSN